MKIFAERIRKLRTEKGISVKALGKAIGVSGATIIRWETGNYDTTSKNIVKLAIYFGVSANYLLGKDSEY